MNLHTRRYQSDILIAGIVILASAGVVLLFGYGLSFGTLSANPPCQIPPCVKKSDGQIPICPNPIPPCSLDAAE